MSWMVEANATNLCHIENPLDRVCHVEDDMYRYIHVSGVGTPYLSWCMGGLCCRIASSHRSALAPVRIYICIYPHATLLARDNPRFTLPYRDDILMMLLPKPRQVGAMLREIVNSQNAQITFMRSFLTDNNATLVAEECQNDLDSDDGNDTDVPGYAIGIMAVLGVLCLTLLATILVKAKSAKDRGAVVGGGGQAGSSKNTVSA